MNDRLARLAAADPGFFLLATHAKIEGLVRQQLPASVGPIDRFSDLVHAWFRHRIDQVGFEPRDGLRERILRPHAKTNQVRHAYDEALEEEALAAARTLVEFLQYGGFTTDPELPALRALTQAWEANPWTLTPSPRLRSLQAEVELLRQRAAHQLAERDALREQEALATKLAADLAWPRTQLAAAEARARTKDEAYDQKRAEVDEKRRALRALEDQVAAQAEALARYEDLRRYLDGVGRLSALTRTRRAFEDQVMRLTPDQQALVDRLPVDRETLIRGGAGSGKSLVLLKLLQRILTPHPGDLDFAEARPTALLLTYTRALTKYGSYLAGLLGLSVDATLVRTADSVLQDLSGRVLERSVDYKWVTAPAAAALVADQPLSANELRDEAELWVWGWNLSLEEYVDGPRTGFRRPLTREERRRVWDTLTKIEAALDRVGVLPPPVAARRLLAQRQRWADRRVDYVLLDEAQDLAPVRLEFFRALAQRGFVLAADDGQTLYQNRSPFVRAGLDIAGGRTRVLRTNFRNTVEIEAFALPFYDGARTPAAFRNGPAPEVVFGAHTEDLHRELVVRIRLFLDEFGYAPENLLILHPGGRDRLEERLAAEGLVAEDVGESGFRFEKPGVLRLSTLLSAKGLDAPVVFVVWNRVFLSGTFSTESQERQNLNLFYVAATRALEHLVVLVRDEDSPVTRRLGPAREMRVVSPKS